MAAFSTLKVEELQLVRAVNQVKQLNQGPQEKAPLTTGAVSEECVFQDEELLKRRDSSNKSFSLKKAMFKRVASIGTR